MEIDSMVVGPIQATAWLVWDPDSRAGFLIDPGDEPERLAAWVESRQVRLEMLVGTHGHLDHVAGAAPLQEKLGLPFALHPADRPLLEAMPDMARQFGLPPAAPPVLDRELAAGETLRAGALELTVAHTPGHSPGSVTLQGGNHLFCGDLVFAGSVGRTDLPGGSMEELVRSIREQILTLDDGTVIHPGHGPDTTVGRERAGNPFF